MDFSLFWGAGEVKGLRSFWGPEYGFFIILGGWSSDRYEESGIILELKIWVFHYL